MNALVHQTYSLSEGSFIETKHNIVPWNLFFNKRSGAVVMSLDSEWLGAAVVAGVCSKLTQPSGISYFSLYTFFWSTCIIHDSGSEFFVEVCSDLNYDLNYDELKFV